MDMPAANAPLNTETEPRGDLCIRTLAMPADTNANGDIFGGWLLSQMDIGGGVFASKIARLRSPCANWRGQKRRWIEFTAAVIPSY